MSHITHLPDEIFGMIAVHLSPSDVGSLVSTCRRIRNVNVHEWKCGRFSWGNLITRNNSKVIKFYQNIHYSRVPYLFHNAIMEANVDRLRLIVRSNTIEDVRHLNSTVNYMPRLRENEYYGPPIKWKNLTITMNHLYDITRLVENCDQLENLIVKSDMNYEANFRSLPETLITIDLTNMVNMWGLFKFYLPNLHTLNLSKTTGLFRAHMPALKKLIVYRSNMRYNYDTLTSLDISGRCEVYDIEDYVQVELPNLIELRAYNTPLAVINCPKLEYGFLTHFAPTFRSTDALTTLKTNRSFVKYIDIQNNPMLNGYVPFENLSKIIIQVMHESDISLFNISILIHNYPLLKTIVFHIRNFNRESFSYWIDKNGDRCELRKDRAIMVVYMSKILLHQ